MSARILTELENIDDDAENKDIFLVKLDIDQDNKNILTKYDIPDKLPQLALFEDNQPLQLFEGNLENEDDALEWLVYVLKIQLIVYIHTRNLLYLLNCLNGAIFYKNNFFSNVSCLFTFSINNIFVSCLFTY